MIQKRVLALCFALHACTSARVKAPVTPGGEETITCSTNNGGCGDPFYYQCTDHQGAIPTCANTNFGANVWVEVEVFEAAATGDRRLISNGQIFGGAQWYPLGMWGHADLLASRILEPGHRMGALRYSLQYLTDVPGQVQADFDQQLAAFPDNDFLRAYRDAGGEVLLNIDGMPAWLADESGPTGDCPASTRSRPPISYSLWQTEVVEPIVAYFTAQLGPGLSYSLWNEPAACYWLGTTEEFLALYAATAKGILAQDPTAHVGGPELNDFYSTRTQNDPPGDKGFFLARLIEFAGTYLPSRLPLDFINYHSYDVNPTKRLSYLPDAKTIGAVREMLDSFGYQGATTQIMNTEWHYRVFENKYTNNLNTSHVEAAYVGAAMVAFHVSGLDNHAAQSWRDYGSGGQYDVISPMMNDAGIPRAGFNVFEMLNLLSGEELKTSSNDPWSQTLAFSNENETLVFVSHFTPSDSMSMASAGLALSSAHPALATKLAQNPSLSQAYNAYLNGPSGVELPAVLASSLNSDEAQAVVDSRQILDEDRARRGSLGVGGQADDALKGPFSPIGLRVSIDGSATTSTAITHARVDSQHVVDADKVKELGIDLGNEARRLACESSARLVAASDTPAPSCPGLELFCASGDSSGLGGTPTTAEELRCQILSTYVVEFVTTQEITQTVRFLADLGIAPVDIRPFQDEHELTYAKYSDVYAELWKRPDVALQWEEITSQASFVDGRLIISIVTEPYSVHLFRIRR